MNYEYIYIYIYTYYVYNSYEGRARAHQARVAQGGPKSK